MLSMSVCLVMMNDDVMICPKERGYGVDKGIPTLVIAAASVDDVLAISGFTILLGITFKPDADLVSIIFQGPLEALVGLVFGTAYGALVAFLPARPPQVGHQFLSTWGISIEIDET